MAYKPTGQKPGRPLKSVSKAISKAQNDFIELTLRSSLKNAAEIARELNVTRAAVSKWRRDPVIIQELTRRNTQEIAKNLSDRLNRKSESEESPIRRELARFQIHKRIHVEAWVRSNWPGPFALNGSERQFNTQSEYVDYLLKNDYIPYDLLEGMRGRVQRRN